MPVRVHRIVLFYFIVRLTFLVGVKALRRIFYVERLLSVLLFPIRQNPNNVFIQSCMSLACNCNIYNVYDIINHF